MRWSAALPGRRRPGVDDADAGPIRRIGWQLAALLVGLLCALLLALVAVIYFRTQADTTASLQDALRSRAASEMYHLIEPALPDQQQHPIRESSREEQERGEIFIVFADQHLTFLGGSAGPFGQTLPDRAAAQRALQTRKAGYSKQRVAGLHYLIYTKPAVYGGRVVGVVQTGASTRSYDQSLEALLQSLLLVCALGLIAAAGITGLVVRRALLPIRAALRHQRDFVADAAHELRAPLTILRTAAELWLEPGSIEDQEEAVEQVLVQSNHLARLVDDLSLLARVDSGAVSVAHDRIDFGRLVAEVVDGVALLAEERNVRLRLTVEEVQVRGDASRLRQLLLILLDNALKHTPPDGVIEVQVARHGGHVHLQVRDTGPGIEPRDLPYLFDRFYRADRARSGEGTGLGLAIGRWIVMAHGGSIRAANARGGGALFTVVLPRAAGGNTVGSSPHGHAHAARP
jgi:two-component system, OmpR family, sensor histidine kinase CiaH